MTRHFVLGAKFVFGVLPCVIGALVSLFGITKMIEAQVAPSKIFGRAPLTLEHAAVFALAICSVIGGFACSVAWLKELRGNQERNPWLIAGLVVGMVAIAAIAMTAGYFGARSWLTIAMPALLVSLTLLLRECRLAEVSDLAMSKTT